MENSVGLTKEAWLPFVSVGFEKRNGLLGFSVS